MPSETYTHSEDRSALGQTLSTKNSSLTVKHRDNRGVDHVKVFTGPFVIGRDNTCDVQVDDDCVSRRHVKVEIDKGVWTIRDLESTNGLYLDDRRVTLESIVGTTRLKLGNDGPTLVLQTDQEGLPSNQLTRVENRRNIESKYIDPDYEGPIGDFTRFVRHVVAQNNKKQSRSYMYVIGLFVVLLLGTSAYLIYQQYRLEQIDSLAVDLFYNMKEIELQLAQLESVSLKSQSKTNKSQIIDVRSKLAQMEANYDAYLKKGGLVPEVANEKDRLILRVARIFGECEVNLPKEFIDEVKRYIAKWKSSNRLVVAIQRAKANGYPQIVANTMLEHYLPPQFFYLALQESDFKRNSIGPKTKYGIAKGVWQFIPSTATRYGLHTGPLIEQARYDPKDDRFDVEKSTQAAARYIREIYNTDAQASGLLVMASYNWGERQIIERIREMPKNPRERNFWKLIKTHQLPRETYDYVYYIFSAAVIGENPRLFGFDFENPLTSTE